MALPPPTMRLEFVHAPLIDPRLTCTRAGPASFIDRDGMLRFAGINEPRIAYDPLTRERKGLLIESARTNLALRSEELDNASWTKSAVTITANAATAPQGGVIADKIVEAASSVRHYAAQSIAFTAGQDYGWSVDLKRSERKRARIRLPSAQFASNSFVDVDLSTGAVTAQGAGALRSGIVPRGGGWHRAYVIATATASASGNAEIELLDDAGASAYAGDGTSGLYAINAQLEIGAFPSSYIATTSAAVTRPADVIGFPLADLLVNLDGAALLAEWSADHAYPTQTGVTQSYMVATLSDGSAANYIRAAIATGGAPQAVVRAASVTGANLAGAALGAGQAGRVVMGWSKDNIAAAFSAAAVQTDLAADLPSSISKLTIGRSETDGANSYLDGYIRRLIFFNGRPTNAELQALAA